MMPVIAKDTVASGSQCRRLGELQHVPDGVESAVELGAFLERPALFDRSGSTVCDLAGLGAEDL